MTEFSKTQKGIIVLSFIWSAISLLIAAGISDSGSGFSLVAFLGVAVVLTFPVWAYWAGVWIWGFGYILKLAGWAKQLSHKILRGALVLLTIGFACASVVLLLNGLGIEIPPALNGIFGALVILAIHQQTKWKIAKFSNRQLFLSTFVAIIAAVLAYSGVVYLKQHDFPDKVMAELESMYPAYKSMKTHEPEMYEKIKAFTVNGLKEKKSIAEINNSISPVVMEYVQKKIPYTSDTIIVNYLKADLQVAKDLSSTAPEKCVSLLLGRPHGDLGKTVRKESMDAELAALHEIIIAPRNNNLKIATAEESQAVFEPILIRQANAFNIPVANVGHYFEGNQDQRKSCQFIMAVMNDLFALPVSIVAPVLRNGAQNP
jgi:hypothetical protein